MPKVPFQTFARHALATLGLALLIWAAPASALPESGSRIDPAPSAVTDTANKPVARRVGNQLAKCVADTRADWADQILDLPFASADQLQQVAGKVKGFDICFATWQFDFKTSPVSIVGGMAESRILKLYKSAGVSAFASVTDDQLFASEAAPRNTGEDFAMCLARKDARAVRALIDTVPASEEENAALNKLMPHLSNCIPQGMELKLNKSTVRSYAAFGLYRLHRKYVAAPRPAGGRN